jgi:hypothetical protein
MYKKTKETLKKKVDWFFLKVVFHSVPTMVFFLYLHVFIITYFSFYLFLENPILVPIAGVIFIHIVKQGPDWTKIFNKIKNRILKKKGKKKT